MHFLRNFTIRRVVQVILLAALLVVALAGAYGSAVMHDMHQRDASRDAMTAQLLFLTRAGNVMVSGSPEEKAALRADLPSGAAWSPVSRALSQTPALFSAASNEWLV